MQSLDQFVIVWCFNIMLLSATIWSLFKAGEKVADLWLKIRQLDKSEEAV